MKKLKLNSTAFVGAEVLSRADLKNIMGGFVNPNAELRCGDACYDDKACATSKNSCGSCQTVLGSTLKYCITSQA